MPDANNLKLTYTAPPRLPKEFAVAQNEIYSIIEKVHRNLVNDLQENLLKEIVQRFCEVTGEPAENYNSNRIAIARHLGFDEYYIDGKVSLKVYRAVLENNGGLREPYKISCTQSFRKL